MPLCRGVLESLLPPGSLWVPEEEEGFDHLLAGIAANAEAIREFLERLAHVRDPLLTTVLPDLETEFGIIPDPAMPETTRRQRLLATKTAGNSDGSLDFMQDKLRAAGFDVTVHANSPAADPSLFTSFDPSSITGNDNALFGRDGVVFGGIRGHLLVNGPVYQDQQLLNYTSPEDPVYWPLVFFVGGAATRGPDGVITQIETTTVPITRKDELTRLIVKYKPLHSWAGLVINYT